MPSKTDLLVKRTAQLRLGKMGISVAKNQTNWEPWKPEPGPQLMAYESLADVIGYGGSAGGGKSAWLKILAVREHKKAIIFRREYPRLKDLIEKSRQLLGSSGASYNSNEKKWRNIPGDRILEFGACQHEFNVESWRGIEHDFKGVDEATEITFNMFLFLTGWCRSPDPTQRCRVAFTFNPPSDNKGKWVIEYLAPWLDKNYESRTGRPTAAPGELRYFVGDGSKLDIEVDVTEFTVKLGKNVYEYSSPEPVIINGLRYWPRPKAVKVGEEMLEPRSRTFIAASLDDNPYLRDSGYRSVLQSFPEPLRSQLLYGDYNIQREEDPWQVIPTAWVEAAQKRWLPYPQALEQTHLGVDVARGGNDKTIIAERYDTWVAPLHTYPGNQTPDGQIVTKQILSILKSPDVSLRIDAIGVGAAVVDCCRIAGLKPIPLGSGEAAKDRNGNKITDKTRLLSFQNKRALWWWNMRELLDPSNNILIALPPDEGLKEELCAPRWEESGRVIRVEGKDDLKKSERLGRSTDKADAVIYAFAEDKRANPAEWMKNL